MKESIETAITGEVIDDQPVVIPSSPPNSREVELLKVERNLENLKNQEVYQDWMKHEGTNLFITRLKTHRDNKLIEAENLALTGDIERAVRLLVEARGIRTTIDIIKNEI